MPSISQRLIRNTCFPYFSYELKQIKLLISDYVWMIKSHLIANLGSLQIWCKYIYIIKFNLSIHIY